MVAVCLGVALELGGFAFTPSAWADDGQTQADQAAATIATASPAQVVAPMPTGDSALATVGDTQVSLPATSDGAVTIATTDPSLSSVATPVSISLAKETGGKHAKQAKDGTTVYPGGSGSPADVAVQVLSDGSIRLSTVLASKTSPTRFTYTIGGATPELQADGSVKLVQTTDTGGVRIQTTVGTIAPAWAKDAKGQPVATHYEVKGNGQLVQVVSPDKNAAYPVVADPQILYRWYGIVVQFNRSQTNNIAFGATLAGIMGATLSKSIFGVVLALTGGIYAATAGWAYNSGGCLQITVTGIPPMATTVPWRYFGGYCR